MALLPLGVSSVWGGQVPPSRARYNAIDTHGNREGQNVSSVSPCDLESTVRSKVVSTPGNEPRESAIATLAFISGAQSRTVLLGRSVSKGGPSAVTRGPV